MININYTYSKYYQHLQKRNNMWKQKTINLFMTNYMILEFHDKY